MSLRRATVASTNDDRMRPGALLRVNADMIDRFVNEAGELLKPCK